MTQITQPNAQQTVTDGACAAPRQAAARRTPRLATRVAGLSLALAATGMLLGGCDTMSKKQQTAAIGAAIGGVAGAVLTGTTLGTVGGAAIGGAIGSMGK